MPLTWVDLTFIIITTLSVFIGLYRGFIREALSLFVWILAVWVAVTYVNPVSDALQNSIANYHMRVIAAFTLLFIATVFLGAMLNHLIGRFIQRTGLTGVDHVLGILFGFLRSMLLLALIALAINFTPFVDSQTWHDSLLVPFVNPMAKWLAANVPNHLHDGDVQK